MDLRGRGFSAAQTNATGPPTLAHVAFLRPGLNPPHSKVTVLASAPEKFEQGKWYTLLLETKGDDVVAQVEGKQPLRAANKDFRVRKPGIEFRVAGPDGAEASFDNLRVWELK